MKPSSSIFVQFESIPMAELFKCDAGAFGIYLPLRDVEGRVQPSLAKIASNAKSAAVHAGKACITETLVMMEQSNQGDLEAPIRLLKVTVTEQGQRSARSLRYISSQKPDFAERRRGKMRAFAVNLDGQDNLMVGARSANEAAGLLGTTTSKLKTRKANIGPEDESLAVASPGVVLRQLFSGGPWEPTPATEQ
ncbi:hypothetical protein NPS53_09035 [Pseudomonas putida]|uniref:hypothetical protein n=1 Tax=Pseudomonas putida TaxID=303 RepID=UPI002363A1E7|nr:hypothetical protein [Pseudomonas putida]MDD2139719.1 hypothetical protein [Pseudomonas putida]HDS1721643.1 hypothetical protein [Pseudomonas putida]